MRAALAACTIATALAALGYLSASGFSVLLAVSLLHALALAPTTNLADALAVIAAKREGFEYGWARGAGSAAFIHNYHLRTDLGEGAKMQDVGGSGGTRARNLR